MFENFRTPMLDDTVKLIEQMVHTKDTNARVEKRREDSKVAGIGGYNSNRKPSKHRIRQIKKVEDGTKEI